MRQKLFLLLLAIFTIQGSKLWAQAITPKMTTDVEHPVCYKMYHPYSKTYVTYDSASKKFGTCTKNADEGSLFYFIKNGEDTNVKGHDGEKAPCVKVYAKESGDYFLNSATSAWVNANPRHWFLYAQNNTYPGFELGYSEMSNPDAIYVSSDAIKYTGGNYSVASYQARKIFQFQEIETLTSAKFNKNDGVCVLGTSTDCAFGYSNLADDAYADLSDYSKLVVKYSADFPRLMFNQSGGAAFTISEVANKEYYTLTGTDGDKTGVVDLEKLMDAQGSVHLNAIKASAYNTSVTVTEMYLVKKQALQAGATSITWRVMDGLTVVKQEVLNNCVEGVQYTTRIAAPFVTLNGTKTVTATNVDQTIDLTYTVANDAPFQYSADFANAHWYTLTIRGNKYPSYDVVADRVKNGTIKPSQPKKGDVFAFVGNPWSLNIYNGEIGDGYALGASVSEGNKLKKKSGGEITAFQFEKNGSTLAFAPLTNTVAHINDYNGELGYWLSSGSATDGGSNFAFEPVDDSYITDLFAGNIHFDYSEATANLVTFAKSKLTGNEWDFDAPVDLSDYKYLVVTTVQSPGNMGGFMILTDKTGKRAGNNWGSDLEINYDASAAGTRGGMWLDRWNNQHCACINLDYLKKQGLDVTSISKFSVPNGANISAVYLTNYESGKAVNSTEGWGSCAGDYVRENALLSEGKFGTIALKYGAAVSGANLYTVDSWDGSMMVLAQKEDGIAEAGVPYIYVACDFEGHDASDGNKGSNSNVNFYRIDGNQVSGDWSDNNARDNGLVGYYDGGFWPGAGALNGCYIISQNQLHKITGGDIDLGKNRCFFDPEKYQGPKSSAGVKLYLGMADDEEDIIKAVETSKQNSDRIYDINGREVKSLKKGGLYIVNGMKVYVK